MPARAGTGRVIGVATLWAGLSAGRAARRRVAADRSDAADLHRLSWPVVARRGQRGPLGLGAARLCLRARLLRRRPVLDRRRAVCRYRELLVGPALRRAWPARVSRGLAGRGTPCHRLRHGATPPLAAGADLPLRGGVEHGRMGPRPCLDRAALEPRRLCLVRRLSGISLGPAKRCLGRHLRAQLCGRPRCSAH